MLRATPPVRLSPPGTPEAFLEALVIAAAYRTARGSHYADGWRGALSFLIGLPDPIWITWNIRLGGTADVPLGALS